MMQSWERAQGGQTPKPPVSFCNESLEQTLSFTLSGITNVLFRAVRSAPSIAPGTEWALSQSSVNEWWEVMSSPMAEVFKQRATKDAICALGTHQASSPGFCESVARHSGHEGLSEVCAQPEAPSLNIQRRSIPPRPPGSSWLAPC